MSSKSIYCLSNAAKTIDLHGQPDNSLCFSAVLYLWLVIMLITASGCSIVGHRERHIVSASDLKAFAAEHAPGESGIKSVRLYFDASTSMRGFALAATQNIEHAPEEYKSIIMALDSIPAMLQGNSGDGRNTSLAVARFGGTIEELSDAGMVSSALGRIAIPMIGGAALDKRSESRDYRATWGGSSEMRGNIDSFYSETITCLNRVFDEILKTRSRNSVSIIVTDAEQAAPSDSTACPSARNLGTIQENLYEWVRLGNFVAVVAFRLPTMPWRSQFEPSQYTSCDKHLLYAYLMMSSAEQAEAIYSHIATFWKGNTEAIAYLPFTPRPASEYEVVMKISSIDGKPGAIIPPRATRDLTNPERGTLPIYWVRLTGEEAEVKFVVTEAAFEDHSITKAPGFCPIDWSRASYEWQAPVRLEPLVSAGVAKSDAKSASLEADYSKAGRKSEMASGGGTPERSASPAAKPAMLISAKGILGLEFIQLPDSQLEQTQHAVIRTAHFHARNKLLPKEHMLRNLSSVRFNVRRRGTQSSGCEIYLIQLNMKSIDYLDKIAAKLPLVIKAGLPCLSLENVKTQMRFVYRPSPVVRFLLHIDY
ncbi:MAG: hypothetical protein JXA73_03325 [Acidobacteria bacterium]|nr:hypothetical protein [Acidobacteriota bacterium]